MDLLDPELERVRREHAHTKTLLEGHRVLQGSIECTGAHHTSSLSLQVMTVTPVAKRPRQRRKSIRSVKVNPDGRQRCP